MIDFDELEAEALERLVRNTWYLYYRDPEKLPDLDEADVLEQYGAEAAAL
jgi:hypothetical protein